MWRFGGFTAAQNLKWLIVCTVYVVDSVYIDFWWNLIIYTIPMEKTIKTGFLRRYGGKSAAVCASNSQPDLYQMSSIFLWELKQCNCAYIGILLKDRLFIQIRRRCSGGRRRRRRRRRRKTDFTDSICSEEYIFQFSAKSDNIYYVFLQNSQIPSLIPPLN